MWQYFQGDYGRLLIAILGNIIMLITIGILRWKFAYNEEIEEEDYIESEVKYAKEIHEEGYFKKSLDKKYRIHSICHLYYYACVLPEYII